MAARIPRIGLGMDDYLSNGMKTIQTPFATERMLNGPVIKVWNPLLPSSVVDGVRPKSDNDASLQGRTHVAAQSSNFGQFLGDLFGAPAQSTAPPRLDASAQAVAAAKARPPGGLPMTTGREPAFSTDPGFRPPARAGNGAASTVRTSPVGRITADGAANNQFGQPMTWFPSSGTRSVADLLTGVGAYGTGSDRLTPGAPRPPAALPPMTFASMYGPKAPPVNQPTRMDLAAIEAHNRKKAVVPANPGLDTGGWFGRPQAYFPPEQVPPPGVDATVWAEPSAAPIGGGAAPSGSPLAALFAPATNGYAYDGNGKQVGKADWTAGLTPEEQYLAANLRGQIAATDPARKVGTTKVQQVKQQTGASSAAAYDKTNAAAKAAAAAKATKPVYQSSGGGGAGDWFSSVTA